MPVERFLTDMYATDLAADELLLDIQVPSLPAGMNSRYLRLHRQQRPTLGVAVAVKTDDEVIGDIRIAVDLRVVRQAMRDQHKLSIVYRDPQGAKTKRIIWPIGVGFFDSRRIIAGWCEMRKDFRSFRADRIEKIKLRTERYPGRRRDLVKQWRAQVDAERRKTLG